MLTTAAIAQSMESSSATNGWDAVCAMNLKQVNALLLQQYLQDGPTSPSLPLRVILQVQEDFWIFDVVLGPPELSFQAGSANATLGMELVRGSLIAFDPQKQAVLNAVRIRPKESKLTGPVTLDKVTGEVNQLGKVVVDLGANAYTPSIAGVAPDSVLNTAIGDAVKTFFACNETKFTLGAIAPDSVPGAFSPTDFHFSIQQKPNSQDACLLLLIKTNGADGTIGPLTNYPIPDDHSAALLISARAVFNGVLVDYLNGSFSKLGTKFKGVQSNNTWSSTVGTGGAVDFGEVGTYQPSEPTQGQEATPWSSGENRYPAAVTFSLDNFTVSLAQNNLSVAWSCEHTNWWSVWYWPYDPYGGGRWMPNTTQLTLEVGFNQSTSAPKVDPISDQVSFQSDKPSVTVSLKNPPDLWDQIWNAKFGLSDAFLGGIQSALGKVFESFQLPSVNAFALVNLLFPAKHVISLKEAKIPADLYLTGSLVQPIEVTPVHTVVAPGGTVQFNASGRAASDILWQIKPRTGSISSTGLYTAPSSTSEAEVVVVTAVSKQDSSTVGSAMVLISQSPAAKGIAIAPGNSVVTPGNTVQLLATDAKGQPVAVNWGPLSPNIGQIKSGWNTGEGIYTAPATLASATDVSASAVSVSDPSQTGVAVIRVTPQATITVTPGQASAKAGGTVALAAQAAAGDAGDLRWAVFPPGVGTVVADSDDPAKATYTAPSKLGNINQARVVVYLVDDQAAGLASSVISLTS